MRKRSVGDREVLRAVGNAPVILPPSHFGSVSAEIRAGDMVMNTALSRRAEVVSNPAERIRVWTI